jgi:hypothetical protein
MRASGLAVVMMALLPVAADVSATQTDPTAVYAQRVQATLTQVATQTVMAQPGLLQAGSFWITCRIGSRGEVQRVQVLSRHRIPGITEAFAAALKSAKFPPIPKAVIKQRGENFLDVKTHFGIDEQI